MFLPMPYRLAQTAGEIWGVGGEKEMKITTTIDQEHLQGTSLC